MLVGLLSQSHHRPVTPTPEFSAYDQQYKICSIIYDAIDPLSPFHKERLIRVNAFTFRVKSGYI